MKYKTLYKLTKKGETEFENVFLKLGTFDEKKLKDKQYSVPIPNTGPFEIKNYKNGYEVADAILNSLGGGHIFYMHQENDQLWKWLTLALYHHVLEGDGKGGKKTKGSLGNEHYGQEARYFPAPITDYQIATRHLIRGAVSLYVSLGEGSEPILSNPLFKPGELREQISQSAILVQSGIAEVLKKLYWNEDKQNLKRGHARSGEGGCRDFVRVLKQLMVTYVIEEMTADEIIAILPSYFQEEWLS